MLRTDKMRLACFMTFTGHHIAGWRHPESTDGLDIAHYVEIAQMAERAHMDAVFMADGVSAYLHDPVAAARTAHNGIRPVEPFTLLAALAMVTRRIGLIGTASTSFFEPYNIARLFGSLDIISGGRSGWNLVTSADPLSALNFGMDAQPPHDERYARAEEFADVVLGLWDSFDEDSFPRDREAGIYLDLDKIRVLDHRGKYYQVKGPLNLPRSPQGWPVIVQAGGSDAGKTLAARTAEMIFSAHDTQEAAVGYYADLKGRMAAFGRERDELKVMTGLLPIVGRTMMEAEDKAANLQSMVQPEVGLARLSALLGGVDLTPYPLDGPLPDMPETNREKSRQALMLDIARRDNLTIRQLRDRVMVSGGHFRVIGTAQTVADAMHERFEAYGTDGYNVMSSVLPRDFKAFTGLVIPELVRRGLFRADYEGHTLRDHLGLKTPGPRRAAA